MTCFFLSRETLLLEAPNFNGDDHVHEGPASLSAEQRRNG